MIINVIDSPCGSGKTEYAIKYMNEHSSEKNFIYVTPFLKEVNRVKSSVNFTMFEPSDNRSSKYKSLYGLVNMGRQIASTHSLLGAATESLAKIIEAGGYELILDEVLTVLEPIGFRDGDANMLLNKEYLVSGDDNVVHVTDKGWELVKEGTSFEDQFRIIDTGRVINVSQSMMLWQFPIDILKAFDKITILTYMFENQTMYNYLKSNGAMFKSCHLKNYELVNGRCSYSGEMYKELVRIYDGKLNNIGKNDYSLSYSWFKDGSNHGLLKNLSLKTYNYLRNIVSANQSRVLWTCPKSITEKEITPFTIRDYKKSFLSAQARAINEYADRDVVAYLINKFENPFIKNHFIEKGLHINENVFALSEMVQWIFRSAIRRGEHIDVYVPSLRMRELLKDWLNGTFEEKHCDRYTNVGEDEYATLINK